MEPKNILWRKGHTIDEILKIKALAGHSQFYFVWNIILLSVHKYIKVIVRNSFILFSYGNSDHICTLQIPSLKDINQAPNMNCKNWWWNHSIFFIQNYESTKFCYSAFTCKIIVYCFFSLERYFLGTVLHEFVVNLIYVQFSLNNTHL